MKKFIPLAFLGLLAGCAKTSDSCKSPTFNCLQGKWIEKEHTDSPSVIKEYIEVSISDNKQAFNDETVAAQLAMTPFPPRLYYFQELPHEDSVALTPWALGNTAKYQFHRYLKMINDHEIEIDYTLPPATPVIKKRYIRE